VADALAGVWRNENNMEVKLDIRIQGLTDDFPR
jgi:hypothetical protein